MDRVVVLLDKVTKMIAKLEHLPPLENMSKAQWTFYLSVTKGWMIDHLEEAMENEQFVEGIIVAATMLESVGQMKLIIESKGVISSDQIKNLEFATVNKCLLLSKIIDTATYSRMERVRGIRNKLAHNMEFLISCSEEHCGPNPELKKVMADAIKAIKTLLPMNERP